MVSVFLFMKIILHQFFGQNYFNSFVLAKRQAHQKVCNNEANDIC
jgi:hypothetical protein